MVELLEANTRAHGIMLFGMHDSDKASCMWSGPEQGITQPGMVIVGGDSHTSTHGAFGNLSFGIGASEVLHTIATQTLWQRRPKTMRIRIDGPLGFGIGAKDVILAIIGRIGIGGAAQHVIEYAGSTISAMSMEQRMTVCNMSIEAGARAGMIAPDATTFAYVEGRPFAPKGAAIGRPPWPTGKRCRPTRRRRLIKRNRPRCARHRADGDVGHKSGACAPDHRMRCPTYRSASADRRAEIEAALSYMGIAPGTRLTDIAVDRVFIGSCTNARIEDLRAAADVARLGRASMPAVVVPGSTPIKRQAEARGSIASSPTPGLNGATPAAPCAPRSTATRLRRASAAHRRPTGISVDARARTAGRI